SALAREERQSRRLGPADTAQVVELVPLDHLEHLAGVLRLVAEVQKDPAAVREDIVGVAPLHGERFRPERDRVDAERRRTAGCLAVDQEVRAGRLRAADEALFREAVTPHYL